MNRVCRVVGVFLIATFLGQATEAQQDDQPDANWLDDAKLSQQLYRVDDIEDPRPGYVFRRIVDSNGGVRVVFVTCKYDIIEVNLTELVEDPGDCESGSISTVKLSYSALAIAAKGKKTPVHWWQESSNSDFAGWVLSGTFTDESGEFAGMSITRDDAYGGIIDAYIPIGAAQIVAGSDYSFGVGATDYSEGLGVIVGSGRETTGNVRKSVYGVWPMRLKRIIC